MVKTIEAIYDGKAFLPSEPITLEPNTKVKIVIETTTEETAIPSFLDVARSLNLDGPPDWSANLDKYLYGELLPECRN